MTEAVIVSTARSPIGRAQKGSLIDVRGGGGVLSHVITVRGTMRFIGIIFCVKILIFKIRRFIVGAENILRA